MTKKILFYLVIITLLAGLVVGSPAFPHPIHGKIMAGSDPILNVKLEVKNLNNGIVSETMTNEAGFFQVDLGNIDPNQRDGDLIKVSLIYCKSLLSCSKTVAVSGGGNEVSFNIVSESIPVPTDPDVVIVKFVCWDNSAVNDMADCPVDPVVQVQCADGSLVDLVEDCPESNNGWIAVIITTIAVILGGIYGGGWKIYNGKFKHYHRGLNSYHDPSTRHRNAKYRHTLWEDSAIGCIRDVKTIQKGIDLSLEGGN